MAATLQELCAGLPKDSLPKNRPRDLSVPHAPVRTPKISNEEKKLVLINALRYFPTKFHGELAPEFAEELRDFGHIYMYRFRPMLSMRAYPINEYPSKCLQAASIMHMIMNNLNPEVAQFPHELVTYGGNGQVFSNWVQFLLVMHYLSKMTEQQTLVMYSGHPMGLFPSNDAAPRMVITNGMMIPNYSSKEIYEKLFALGVTMYGQMTAGSYCYIGPQGIVHGTTLTLINAARMYLKTDDLSGKVFVTSGLGGMSGAQAKAAVIAGCVGVVAEVDRNALLKRYNQGWLLKVASNLDHCIELIRTCKKEKIATSIGYHGNVVDLWNRLIFEYERTGELLVELGSDQTSCHNPFAGGYYPMQINFEESQIMMHENPDKFRDLVQETLRHHVKALNKLSQHGMFFWDYGNAFLLEADHAGADVGKRETMYGTIFRYPSYVQDIMGDIFSLGFGPFRWVCTSGKREDLEKSDQIATSVLERVASKTDSAAVKEQYQDNIRWIKEAGYHKMVVGSQARILYADQNGRSEIALAFNTAVKEGTLKVIMLYEQLTGLLCEPTALYSIIWVKIQEVFALETGGYPFTEFADNMGPVVISRDHHDVSGTDSPFRETSNIYDGSALCADMSIQNVIGDSFRGATWVSIHNGGGVGWGEVMNGGFGLMLDGSHRAEKQARSMLAWDVSNGVARRSWSGNTKAQETIQLTMKANPSLQVTLPNSPTDQSIIEHALKMTE